LNLLKIGACSNAAAEDHSDKWLFPPPWTIRQINSCFIVEADPLYADRRNFDKVEKWSRDGLRVELVLYAGNNVDKAHRIFELMTTRRPRIRLTIRQRMRVLDEWPRNETIL
jgi:hypothetical protein